jgi:hypothetical protein
MRAAPLLALALFAAACTSNGDSCDDIPADLGDVCVPDSIAPGLTAIIEVRELCGNACSDIPTCTAVFRNAQVTLDTSLNYCVSSQTARCLQAGCQQRVIPCALPSLNAGDWTLNVPGGPPRLLRVADGGQSSCHFIAPDGGVQ